MTVVNTSGNGRRVCKDVIQTSAGRFKVVGESLTYADAVLYCQRRHACEIASVHESHLMDELSAELAECRTRGTPYVKHKWHSGLELLGAQHGRWADGTVYDPEKHESLFIFGRHQTKSSETVALDMFGGDVTLDDVLYGWKMPFMCNMDRRIGDDNRFTTIATDPEWNAATTTIVTVGSVLLALALIVLAIGGATYWRMRRRARSMSTDFAVNFRGSNSEANDESAAAATAEIVTTKNYQQFANETAVTAANEKATPGGEKDDSEQQ